MTNNHRAWFAHNDRHRVGNLGNYLQLYQGQQAPPEVMHHDGPRVVVVNWWQNKTNTGFVGLRDLRWADLIVCMTSECIVSHTTGDWQTFYDTTCEFFDNSNCVFVGGGRHRDWHSEKIFSEYRFFFLEVLRANQLTWHQPVIPRQKPYLFDVLLGKHKPERWNLLQWLKQQDLADRSLINMHANPFDLSLNCYFRTPALDQLENCWVEKIWNDRSVGAAVPNCTDCVSVPTHDQIPVWASCLISSGIYESSWYSVVCETFWSSYDMVQDFLTEKTAKALYAGRIFVLLATPGSLSRLREMGFETFGHVIDESYDSIQNDILRMRAIQQQILRLSRLDPIAVYDQCSRQLSHNHRHFQRLFDQKALNDFLQYHIMNTIPR